MQTNPRFDDFLFTIVKETGGLEGLLHALFSFLYRRTDFFYEADPGDKMGFPPGYAPRMLYNIMETYQKEQYKKYPKKDPAEYQAKLQKFQEAQGKKPQEETKVAEGAQTGSVKSTTPSTQTGKEQKVTSSNVQEKIVPEQKVSESTEPKKEKAAEKTEVPSNNPPKQHDPKFSSISTYNGAATDKYNWSQGINEVTVQVPVPAGTRAKNLAVDMTATKVKVVLKTEGRTIIEGEWYERIKVDDSTWSVDEDSILFNLEKANENIWKTVLKGDQEIDATKVDNSKPIEAFDSETQGALKKIMYEQQRKQMGLPTTEEEAQQEMLKKAWNAEGSPFKGQPFDPSKFNLSNNNMNLNM